MVTVEIERARAALFFAVRLEVAFFLVALFAEAFLAGAFLATRFAAFFTGRFATDFFAAFLALLLAVRFAATGSTPSSC